jgi:adenosylhomocysteine nucleosidase
MPRGPLGTPLLFDEPCIVFALRRESQAFRREFPPTQRFAAAPCSARFCGPPWLSVLVLETGIGRAATERALDWLLCSPLVGNVAYRPKVVVSAGFCGALQDGWRTGEVLLASEVVDTAGGYWPTTWPTDLPPGPWVPPLRRGRLLTSAAIAAAPADKRALGRRHEAAAVDMEGAALAQRCTAAGLPFGSVRVVLDDVQTPLSPRLASLMSAGRVSPWRLALAVLRSPKLLPELWRLGRAASQAGEVLRQALGELLTLTLPWAADEIDRP